MKPRFVEKLINGNKTLKKFNAKICKFCQKYYPKSAQKISQQYLQNQKESFYVKKLLQKKYFGS